MVSSESLDEKDVGVIVGANQLPENEDERRLAEMGHVVSTFPLLPNLKGNGDPELFPVACSNNSTEILERMRSSV